MQIENKRNRGKKTFVFPRKCNSERKIVHFLPGNAAKNEGIVSVEVESRERMALRKYRAGNETSVMQKKKM